MRASVLLPSHEQLTACLPGMPCAYSPGNERSQLPRVRIPLAQYRIVSTVFSPPCVYGQLHLESVRFTPGMSLSYDIPIAELLAMRQQGDLFLLTAQVPDEEAVPARFRRCACGNGYILRIWRPTQDNLLPLQTSGQRLQA